MTQNVLEMDAVRLPERWAQRRGGRKMHIVTDYGDGRVALVARCGARPDPSRRNWRMTANVPFANGCRNCRRSRPRNLVRPVEG